MNKRFKLYVLIMVAVIVILNVTAWLSKGFCDWYIKNIFQIWPETFGRIMGLFPFSVGEIMIIIGILIVPASVVNAVLTVIFRKNRGYVRMAKGYFKVILVIFLNVCLVMTLNCTLLYHCTPLDPNSDYEDRKYTIDELVKLEQYIAEQCNFYSGKMKRDERGNIIYDKDIKKEARLAMKNISKYYPRLKGYFPNVKDLAFSNLFSQAYISGYYFPFSMEANANTNMYIANCPFTYCHELAHLKGYIYEDEANFLSYLAGIESGDDFFAYSAYISVYWYVLEAVYDSAEDMPEEWWDDYYSRNIDVYDIVYDDMIFLSDEAWNEVEDTALVETDKVEQAADSFVETSLQLNGVSEGIAAYNGVVELLLKYYDGELYQK